MNSDGYHWLGLDLWAGWGRFGVVRVVSFHVAEVFEFARDTAGFVVWDLCVGFHFSDD